MNFTYGFITYEFYIRIYYIRNLHKDLLLTNPNPYVIIYESKSACNYLRILHTDLLHMNFTYGPNPYVITYGFFCR